MKLFLCGQGVQTGLSARGFSVSLNERNLGGNIIEDGLQAVLQGSPDVAQYLRQVIQHVPV